MSKDITFIKLSVNIKRRHTRKPSTLVTPMDT